MTTFTPLASFLGGALIGASALLLLVGLGRIAGISGIVSALLPPFQQDGAIGVRLAFLAGLIGTPLGYKWIAGHAVQQTVSGDLPLLASAGLLVGFGTVLGSGCTSGHGVCGLSRLSVRSLVATLVFMTVAAATVFVQRHVLGG